MDESDYISPVIPGKLWLQERIIFRMWLILTGTYSSQERYNETGSVDVKICEINDIEIKRGGKIMRFMNSIF